MKIPNLLGRRGVAALIKIDVSNISHQRRTKGFPEPVLVIDGFPLWLQSDIEAWIDLKAKKQKGALPE